MKAAPPPPPPTPPPVAALDASVELAVAIELDVTAAFPSADDAAPPVPPALVVAWLELDVAAALEPWDSSCEGWIVKQAGRTTLDRMMERTRRGIVNS
jgi:hypothetical protein